jgi:xanthine dehydrogenase YagS FAD-binding subunit
VTEAERGMSGIDVRDKASFGRAADAVLQGARGFGHNDFKVKLAKRTIERTVVDAAA